MRIQLNYAAKPAELTSDSDTTSVPKDYIINKAIEILAGKRLSSSRADRDRWAIMEQLGRQNAEDIRRRKSDRLSTTIPIEYDHAHAVAQPDDNDPLGWYN